MGHQLRQVPSRLLRQSRYAQLPFDQARQGHSNYQCRTALVFGSERTREYYKDKKDKAPVIDVLKAGYMKVVGKGKLPEQPVIVKARYFSREAEEKIKSAGGVCVLCA